MRKADLRLLEKVFNAEIYDKLPFQSKAGGYQKLAELGMVEFGEIVLPGRFPVTVSGWYLTHLGRYTYCKACDEGGAAG